MQAQAAAAPPPDVKGRFTSHPALEKENYDFFDVQLYTPAGERLRPVDETQDNSNPRTWRKRVYCVTPGTPFELRYTLDDANDIRRWGGRVFVNAGGGHLDDVTHESAAEGDPTHLFWFGDGQTEFRDTGFYEGNERSRRFVVGKSEFAAEDDAGMDDGQRRSAASQLGSIRVHFTAVTQITEVERPPRRAGARHVTPLLPYCGDVAARERKAQEFSCVVAPGARVVDDHDATTAVLSPDTDFEYRIGFVHFAVLSKHLANPRSFGGLPLSLFAEVPSVRRRLVELALNDLQGVNRPTDITTSTDMEIEPYESNPAIVISDVVHHISRLVSPAASYFTCMGSFRQDRCVPRASLSV
jgi:hypothetical protein